MKGELKSITTAATLIATGASTSVLAPRAMALRNSDAATTTVYLGGADVDSTNGWPMDATFPTVDIVLDPGDTIYGITDSGTATVRVLRSGT